ncbi:nucleoid-associated protein [Vreelandella venusta]|uniref:nucleoid-associated protein n=1 Tax=Vreelandella venusta TaxID=44935 RepID=UPI0035577C47
MAGKPLEGVLTQEQRKTLEIEDFIFHIIDPDAPGKVIKLDEVQLQDKQKAFFLDRLRDIAEGTQYVFNLDAANLQEHSRQLIHERDGFINLSYSLTQEFARLHGGQMSAGVFIVSVVKYLAAAHDWRQLVFLVKMDQQESFTYSYEERDGKRVAIVNEIPNALNENKRAIQKSALIDSTDRFAWDVLAFDRVKRPMLGDYFRDFLGVIERQQDSVLTKSAHAAVRKWAKEFPKEDLPQGEDVNTYLGRAFNYLKDNDTFDTDGFLNVVIRDEDATRKEDCVRSLHEVLADAGVAGQSFRPRPDSLPKKQRKQTYETVEGVTIIYEGTQETAGIDIDFLEDGGAKVTISTHKLIPKG